MTTECSEPRYLFQPLGRREVVARFDGGAITSDGGALLLREVEARTGIVAGLAACFRDLRDPLRIEHSVAELVTQRVFGLALGYEDLVDHDDLRRDPLLAVAVGRLDAERPLAGKSTLNRLELTRGDATSAARYQKIVIDQAAVDRLLVEVFVKAYDTPPQRIVLDLDATDDPLHGHQEGRFFHGYYDCYCYLPLYIFSGEHLLCARLRPSDIDGAAGSVEELTRIVAQIRSVWPAVAITIRADSGFCREELMAWCEGNAVDYVLGLARNARLEAEIAPTLELAGVKRVLTGRPARIFKELCYRTLKSWSRSRRVVAKAESLEQGSNPRFIVTSLHWTAIDGRTLYEDVYCARGDMENRIKEQQLYLFADRTSAATMRANQIRLDLSSVAYVLLAALRRLGLAGTEMAHAQCHTIRVKLLKIGALVTLSARKVWVSLASGCPYAAIFATAWAQLRAAPA
jgi:hypothetical protein